jgi:hypothetical protein
LDLYAMGLAAPDEVPDFYLLDDATPTDDEDSLTFTATKREVAIEQVIAASGERVPSAADAQKDYRAALIAVVREGETPTASELRALRALQRAFEEHWSAATGGKSTMTARVVER